MFGYSLPLGSVVSTAKGGVRKVELPFSSPIRDLLVQDLTVKVRTCALKPRQAWEHKHPP